MQDESAACQDEIFAFLGDAATYGLATGGAAQPVRRIDTHGAAVFLAGDDVYKVKRAIRLPYLDYSTLAKRRAACETEVAVNRAYAPLLYLGVVPVTRAGAGFRLGGPGEAVEWTVHLRRFDENATFDHLAERGALDMPLLDALGRSIAAAHAHAPRRRKSAATTALHEVVVETLGELRDAPDMFQPAAVERLASDMTAEFERRGTLLLAREARGDVRRCHGDLHLRNIALVAGEPVLFDAIEFDEAIAVTDILYDLAFLLMDLCERRLVGAANRVQNRYLWTVADAEAQIDGLALLPLFLSLRAAIRGKVAVTQYRQAPDSGHLRDEARDYVAAAQRFLARRRPVLVGIGGLSGSGKSTLAAALAPSLGVPPGAVHFSSDIERKRLFKARDTERLPADAYTSEISALVYARLEGLAAAALRAGRSVVVDATHQLAAGRAALGAVARRAGADFAGLWLDAPAELLTRRVSERHGDPSDATAAVVAAQLNEDVGAMTWRRFDSSLGVEQLAAQALRAVQDAALTGAENS